MSDSDECGDMFHHTTAGGFCSRCGKSWKSWHRERIVMPEELEEFPRLIIDPRRQCGHPCIEGTRIEYDIIAYQIFNGDDVDQIAEWYGITHDAVLLCCFHLVNSLWERKITYLSTSEKKVLAAWGSWREIYLHEYGKGTCPTPPS